MTVQRPAPGERLSLGTIRSSVPQYPPLPAPGPAREAALDRLRALIAADAVRTLDAARDAGWHPSDHGEIVAGLRARWAWFVEDAIEDGVYDWRHLTGTPNECSICGAEVSAGRCWGCGAP